MPAGAAGAHPASNRYAKKPTYYALPTQRQHCTIKPMCPLMLDVSVLQDYAVAACNAVGC